jgi:hypothetical protein
VWRFARDVSFTEEEVSSMSVWIRSHLRWVLAGCAGVFLFALGGTAYAAFIVNSNADVGPDTIAGHAPPAGDHSNIIAASVANNDLAPNSVGSGKIIDGRVSNADLGAGSVDSSKIATGAVNSNSVLDDSLTSSDLAPNSVGSSEIATDAVNATEIADSSIDSGEIIDNSLFAADLAPNSVGSSEIAADAVGSSEVANESLTTSDIAGIAANGTIALSGIPNGRCTQVTFNFSGAQVGDSPIITTGAAIQNGILLYPNRVASTGHVEVNACNFTGTDMTPISNFPVRIITLR